MTTYFTDGILNMSKIKWRIIKNNLGNGTTEYQVSDGDVGERTVSYDFDNRLDAENCLYDIERKEHE
tara:strand:- start:1040 stop:1240 length:201 start_codon:yes stop_codon:yes gene_type:complete